MRTEKLHNKVCKSEIFWRHIKKRKGPVQTLIPKVGLGGSRQKSLFWGDSTLQMGGGSYSKELIRESTHRGKKVGFGKWEQSEIPGSDMFPKRGKEAGDLGFEKMVRVKKKRVVVACRG